MALPNPPVKRVLVIHTAFLGDLVLATPFLAGLRKILPMAEIRFLTTSGGAALLTPNPWGIIPVVFHKRGKDSGLRGLWRKGRQLKKFAPDLTFSLHRSLRSTLLAKLAGASVWGFKEAAGSAFFAKRVSRAGFSFEAEKNLALLEAWSGVKDFSPYPQLQASVADETQAQDLLGGLNDFVVLAPSSVWATKRWPAQKFGELAMLLARENNLRSVIVGSDAPEDMAAAEAVMAAFRGDGPLPLNLAGRTSLGSLKSVLLKAQVVVSNDSSPLHMAIAMGRKVVGVFGPTTKELGFFPLAPVGCAAVAELKDLACRPCGLHGHDRCPLGHFRCMRDLHVNQVYEEVNKLLCP